MGMPIGDGLAEIDLSSDFVFLDGDGTRLFMEATQNPVSGSEVATVMPKDPEDGWFLMFEYEAIGYVPDDEKDDLDPEAMLGSIRQGTDAANEERRSRGWQTMSTSVQKYQRYLARTPHAESSPTTCFAPPWWPWACPWWTWAPS